MRFHLSGFRPVYLQSPANRAHAFRSSLYSKNYRCPVEILLKPKPTQDYEKTSHCLNDKLTPGSQKKTGSIFYSSFSSTSVNCAAVAFFPSLVI